MVRQCHAIKKCNYEKIHNYLLCSHCRNASELLCFIKEFEWRLRIVEGGLCAGRVCDYSYIDRLLSGQAAKSEWEIARAV